MDCHRGRTLPPSALLERPARATHQSCWPGKIARGALTALHWHSRGLAAPCSKRRLSMVARPEPSHPCSSWLVAVVRRGLDHLRQWVTRLKGWSPRSSPALSEAPQPSLRASLTPALLRSSMSAVLGHKFQNPHATYQNQNVTKIKM